ncbi:antifreeze protein [Profundibacterium mesophilum]|uniref:Antifreeze protein type I n=1 Tax=Profundibacterium mesophilum KAUST100406-0324 TaxID=1037889 RepID=A0A921NWM8_9RHOB|nr:antifreeze protein [Profundibacterium mesophilum]KAF0676810.1 Antifreeze protein type I [Profundibacterium mesophilum KAUST100406-0324]
MFQTSSPVAYWASMMRASQMMAEAQVVIGYRMLGMAGLWAVAPTENTVMLTEKPGALMASGMAASRAMMSGAAPDKIIDAAVKPLGAKTRSNAARLMKRGPRFG